MDIIEKKDKEFKEAKYQSEITIINDPVIEPYFISRDKYCYTLYKMTYPEGGKPYKKACGHYHGLKDILRLLASNKVITNKEHYSSIKEYLNEYQQIEESVKNLLKKLDI